MESTVLTVLKEPLFFDNPFRGKVPVDHVPYDHLEYVVKDMVKNGEYARSRFQFSYANGESVPYMVILNQVCEILQNKPYQKPYQKPTPKPKIDEKVAATMGTAMRGLAGQIATTEAEILYGISDGMPYRARFQNTPVPPVAKIEDVSLREHRANAWDNYVPMSKDPEEARKFWSDTRKKAPEVVWVPQRVASTGRFLIPEKHTRWWLVAAAIGLGIGVAINGGCL